MLASCNYCVVAAIAMVAVNTLQQRRVCTCILQTTIIENYFASSGWAISFSTRDNYTFLPCEGISKKCNYYCMHAEAHHESFPVLK